MVLYNGLAQAFGNVENNNTEASIKPVIKVGLNIIICLLCNKNNYCEIVINKTKLTLGMQCK